MPSGVVERQDPHVGPGGVGGCPCDRNRSVRPIVFDGPHDRLPDLQVLLRLQLFGETQENQLRETPLVRRSAEPTGRAATGLNITCGEVSKRRIGGTQFREQFVPDKPGEVRVTGRKLLLEPGDIARFESRPDRIGVRWLIFPFLSTLEPGLQLGTAVGIWDFGGAGGDPLGPRQLDGTGDMPGLHPDAGRLATDGEFGLNRKLGFGPQAAKLGIGRAALGRCPLGRGFQQQRLGQGIRPVLERLHRRQRHLRMRIPQQSEQHGSIGCFRSGRETVGQNRANPRLHREERIGPKFGAAGQPPECQKPRSFIGLTRQVAELPLGLRGATESQ